jgi:hypothetical protein
MRRSASRPCVLERACFFPATQCGHRCQKQPCTKTTEWSEGNTRSGCLANLASFLLDLLKQSRILDRQHRLCAKGLQKIDRALGKLARLFAPHDQRANDPIGAEQRKGQMSAVTGAQKTRNNSSRHNLEQEDDAEKNDLVDQPCSMFEHAFQKRKQARQGIERPYDISQIYQRAKCIPRKQGLRIRSCSSPPEKANPVNIGASCFVSTYSQFK